MFKAFKYRLYPTASQEEKINQNIGCARFVYNLMLDAKIKHYEQHKETLYITPEKFKDDYPFLKDADSLALSNAKLNLEKAFNTFFDKKTGYPKFKSKHKCRWSYTTNNQRNKKNPERDSIRFDGNRIKLPKVGYVKIVEHRQHEGVIKSVVVSKERSGEYYASVLCEIEQPEPLPVTDKVVGIDLGLHDIVVCSDGERVSSPKHFLKSEQKLAKIQRAFSRTQKDSKGSRKSSLESRQMSPENKEST